LETRASAACSCFAHAASCPSSDTQIVSPCFSLATSSYQMPKKCQKLSTTQPSWHDSSLTNHQIINDFGCMQRDRQSEWHACDRHTAENPELKSIVKLYSKTGAFL
jgi:hypothetical protein